MLPYNPILDTDSYKLPMFGMLPDGIKHTYSYAESRGGRYPSSVFFGLQPFLKRMAENPVTTEHVLEAEAFAAAHGEPFNLAGWLDIVDRYGGVLPLEIHAVAEGTVVPTRNVLATVVNVDPAHAWLTTYVETALLRQVWYGTTVATRIFNMKKRIKEVFEKTADNLDNLPFALLDFSSRGCSSLGANELGGAAYLAHFLGSDSVPAVRYTNHYYGSEMSGFSVPATEHSIMCSWGEEREEQAIRTLIERFGGPGKIVSIVGDTWDIFRFARYAVANKELIHNSGTTLVVRPDSGEAEHVLPRVLKTLGEGLGARKNGKGLHVLNGAKVLWGDGINEETHMRPFHVAWDNGFSADNISTGSGGGLMQADIDRDTAKFAFKASAVFEEGYGWQGIAKNPVTDPGKMSKRGRLNLIKRDGLFETITRSEFERFASTPQDYLRPVYVNGDLLNVDTIDGIRARIDSQL